jgi:hypothetical protein
MKKGKSRMRARGDILRFNAANARRRARQYDQRQYDKPQIEGEGGRAKIESGGGAHRYLR